MSFRRRFIALGVLVLLGFAAIFWIANTTLSRVKVNGPLYQMLARDKDVIGDILPPPQLIVEPYLIVCQVNASPSTDVTRDLLALLGENEKVYRQTHEQWARRLSVHAPGNDGVLARELLEESYRSADAFFRIVDGEWKGAVERGDHAAAQAITADRLDPLYAAHHASILKAVAAAQALVEAHEREAREEVARGQWFLVGASVLTLLLVVIFGGLLVEPALKSLATINLRMQTMAEADADLTARLDIRTRDEVGALAGSIDRFVQKIAGAMGGVRGATDALGGTAVQMHATSRQQETAIHNFGAATTEIAAAVRQISVTGGELSGAMGEAEAVAKHSAGLAAASRAGLADMQSAMQELLGQSGSISEKLEDIKARTRDITGVVVTIAKVADQTNLLSVNAALEAEKAGEHGRGFLVVAREIRRLADQTASATQDIEHTVRQMQGAVTEGVTEMDKFSAQVARSAAQVESIGVTLSSIIESVEVMKERFIHVSQGMGSQNLGARQISESMVNLSENVKVTARSLGEFTRAADQLKHSVGDLNAAINRFRV
ncbi:MAG: methyl-accepting chemotaxis protein [Planctomycetes bacterium]|nr:methyl-accepting chemotaxis protein [Planctomycetota bacterium]